MSRIIIKINADYSRDQLEPVAVLAERYDLNFEMPFRRTSGFKGCRCVFCTFVQFQFHLKFSTPDFSQLLPEIAPSLSLMWATTERPTPASHRGGKTVQQSRGCAWFSSSAPRTEPAARQLFTYLKIIFVFRKCA